MSWIVHLIILSLTLFFFLTESFMQNNNNIPRNQEFHRQLLVNPSQSEPAIYLCAIIKKEDLYVEEWVNYNILIGFEQIHIYDNNDYDTEEPDSSLGNVTRSLPLKYPGKVFVYSFPGHKPRPLISAFMEFAFKFINEDVYAAFFDIDEFLVMNNHSCIRSLLNQVAFHGRKSIGINWYPFGSNNHEEYNNQLVVQRFTKRTIKSNVYIKNIIYLPDIGEFYNAHHVRLRNSKVIYDIYNNTLYNGMSVNRNITEVKLNHYILKSTNEYDVKMKRGESAPIVRTMDLFYKLNKDSVIYDDTAWKITQLQNKSICV